MLTLGKLEKAVEKLNLTTCSQKKTLLTNKSNIIYNTGFKSYKDDLIVNEISKYANSFIKLMLHTEKLNILYPNKMNPNKLTTHQSFNNVFENFLLKSTLDGFSEWSIYMSKFRPIVINKPGYNCVGIDKFKTDSNLLWKKVLSESEYILPCNHGGSFNTFKYKYFLANDFYLNKISVNGEKLSLWDVDKIRNMDYFESFLRINPFNSQTYRNTIDTSDNDLFLYLLLCDNRWHNDFYGDFYRKIGETYPGTSKDDIISSVDIDIIYNTIISIL